MCKTKTDERSLCCFDSDRKSTKMKGGRRWRRLCTLSSLKLQRPSSPGRWLRSRVRCSSSKLFRFLIFYSVLSFRNFACCVFVSTSCCLVASRTSIKKVGRGVRLSVFTPSCQRPTKSSSPKLFLKYKARYVETQVHWKGVKRTGVPLLSFPSGLSCVLDQI